MIVGDPRPRLDAVVSKALRWPVALLRGGAGSGKSMAVLDFLERYERSYVRYAPAGDVVTAAEFVTDFTGVLAPYATGPHPLGAVAAEIVQGGRNAALALSAFFREYVAPGITIVVDDVRTAGQLAPCSELIAALVDATCDRVRWCFIARDLSALPLASWLAHERTALPIDAGVFRFSVTDAQRVAAHGTTALSPDGLARLVDRSAGLPLNVVWGIAVLDDASASALPKAPSDALEYLLDATAAVLTPETFEDLEAASLLPDLEPETLAAFGDSRTAAGLELARTRVPALFLPGSARALRHEIQHALRERSARAGAAHALRTTAALAALEGAGRIVEALQMTVDGGESAKIAGILERHGFELAERGAWPRIQSALNALEATPFTDSPVILALRAERESIRDHFDTAEAWYRMAIVRSQSARERAVILQRFGLEAMRRGRPELVEDLAAPVLELEIEPSEESLPIRATLATALAMQGQHARAWLEIDRVLARTGDGLRDVERARLLQQAAFVAIRAEEYELGRVLAMEAFTTAQSSGAYNVAALAKTLLYDVALEADDDSEGALAHLGDFSRYALLSGGERLHLFALLATFSIHMERGDVEAVAECERRLQGRDLVQHTDFINETLLADEAMRAAWSGDFERAWLLAEPTVERESGGRQMLRLSECAVYAAAAGRNGYANAQLARLEAFKNGVRSPRLARTRALVAVAHSLLGDRPAAHESIAAARREGMTSGPRCGALFATLGAMTAFGGSTYTPGELAGHFSALDASGLGGYRRLFSALPARLMLAEASL